MPRFPSGATLLALLLAPILLRAQESDEPRIRFGFQLTAAAPRNDLRALTPATGRGLGIFFDQHVDEDWNLRTRIDYLSFGSTATQAPSSSELVPPATLQHESNQASLGAEARFHPKAMQGFFLLGGLGISRFEFSYLIPGNPAATPPVFEGTRKTKSSAKLAISGGAGYQITNNFALTVRYTTLNLDGTILSTLEGGLEYRF